MDFTERVVIVTGAGSGIGRAAALQFAREGARVVVVGRTAARLEETLAAVHSAGGEGIRVAADCATPEGPETVVSEAVQAFGGVDVLVNNAGVGWSFEQIRPGSMAALADTSPDNWREVMRINLDSAYYTCHATLPALRRRGGGAIVNVSSAGGLRGMADAHAYATAKAGMVNLTRSLARTYGPEGIRSNCLAPGMIATEMISPVLDSDANPFADDAQRFAVCPLGRPGEPEEMADGVLFLARNGYANGTVLVLDGGSTC